MDLSLTDRIVLIAGSSRGIGLAIARKFLQEGAKVTVTGRDEASVKASSDALGREFGKDRILSFAGNLTEKKNIESLVNEVKDRWTHIDCVVANVGRGRLPPQSTYTQEQWQELFNTNFHGSVLLAQTVLPILAMRKGGSIVFTSSIAGTEDVGSSLPYAVSKAALIAYTKALARLAAKDGVRVNCVAPGNILFPGGAWQRRQTEDPAGTDEYIRSRVPMARFGTPEEIANLVVFLSSPVSSFTTGATFVADGGQTASF